MALANCGRWWPAPRGWRALGWSPAQPRPGAAAAPNKDRVLAAVVVLLFIQELHWRPRRRAPDEHRVGNAAYGRYLACLAPFLVVVGVGRLLQAGVAERLRLALVLVVSVLTVCAAIVVRYGAPGMRCGRRPTYRSTFPTYRDSSGSGMSFDSSA